ncbi:branched-chain alpha-keto acid dehydrogenase E3 subunit (dihydrolipoamide dehydrogenase) [Candidatus Hydrogenisulfobacillus filiaventi]|uniref:Dihydrolipoyl dehydrogenase n=1 Tax=Candidatus Hydrogenisulfobacillus filiaventi TaxID=2707344 RepID=A0A6F8ZJT2_9FIRM|nr:dihydrolipoyl dehydrogenase [Bacillota bacterium]CAB1130249.1 branched-chain alpha-keto acid dehydrogenase E3 subunit (dihydrolipoamide dehydrogenase) [Candidatus Hydrogenisulfobacillus filiaventi]
MAEHFDLTVLGGGTGGYVAAIRAAQLGMHVALVEQEKVGGTCLHRGCIPTKALLHTAELLHDIRHGADFGLKADNVAVDYPRALARKAQVVGQLYRGVQYLMKKNAITVVAGRGRLDGPGRVVVEAEGQVTTVESTDILIATGSQPRALPGIPFDSRRVMNSDFVLDRPDLPASVLVIGGGAIGAEFASMYNDFGVEVTLVEMLPHILPADDEEIAGVLTRLFRRRGIRVLTGARLDLDHVTIDPDQGVRARITTAEGPVEVAAETMLVAIGRVPQSTGIGLESAGVEVDERGFIRVDDLYRTNVPHISAIGDVIGGYLLAHVAAHEGIIAVEAMAGRDPERLSPSRVPRVTYTRPEVAAVGLTAAEAEAAGRRVKVGTFPLRANGRSLILGEADGMVKMVADAETGEMLGAHLIGPHAGELISETALARFLEATAWEVGESVHPHPTVSEVLHEVGLAVDGHAIHI